MTLDQYPHENDSSYIDNDRASSVSGFTRLGEIERQEAAARERFEELEMLTASMGGGKGAELLAVEAQIAGKKLELQQMQAAMEAATREFEAKKLAFEQELERGANRTLDSDAELVRRCLTKPVAEADRSNWEEVRWDCRRVLEELAQGLQQSTPGPLGAVADAIRQLELLDAIDCEHLAEPATVLRNQLTEALSNHGVFEFELTEGSSILPEMERLIAPPSAKTGAVVVSTLRTGFLMHHKGRPPIVLRPAVVDADETVSLAA